MAGVTRGKAVVIGRLAGTTYWIAAPDGNLKARAVSRWDIPLYSVVEVTLSRDADGHALWLISASATAPQGGNNG